MPREYGVLIMMWCYAGVGCDGLWVGRGVDWV